MEYLVRAVMGFVRYAEAADVSLDRPTRDVLAHMRAYLDSTSPGWREKVADDGEPDAAVEVELHLCGGRVLRGAVAQRHSAVSDEAE